jgi:PAS domain S-box-containing protein
VLAASAEATDAPYGIALFVTGDRRTLRVAGVTGEPVCGPAGALIDANEALAEVVWRGVPVILDASALGPAARATAPRVCVAPLVVDGATSGLLCLGISDLEAFRTDDLATLAAFATIAAIAIDRWAKFDDLAASEAKYRALADIGGTIVYDLRVSADGTIDPQWQSDNVRALTGIGTAPLANIHDFEQFLSPADAALFAARWERLRAGGETDAHEWRVAGADGEVRWIEDCARALEREADGSMRIVGGARDVTTLKTAELALRESEEHLRVVVEAASDPMVMTDAEGSIIFTNGAVQRVFGYHADELAHRPLRVLLPEAQRSDREVVGLTRDGREVPLDVSVGHLATAQGVRSTWILRDASARKAEAQQQETLTRVLQTVAREWVATFDAVDSPMLILEPDLTVRRLNRAARNLFGANYGKLIGRKLDELASGDPWATAAEICREAGATNQAQTVQLRDARTRTSWDIFVTVGAATVFPRQEKFLILNLRDVSRIVDLQEANRRSEILAVLGSIVGGVAHEVRNPLFAISATLEAFQKELEGRDEFDEYVAIFKGEIARLTKLMTDLLEFGKPSVREHQHGTLIDTIYAARQQCIAGMQSRGVRVEVETSGNPTLSMDDHRMTQLFKNLIENAVQHSPAGAAVEVRAYYEPGSPYVQCQVIDRGSGFAPADLPRAFEPFFSRRNGGTGLGLSLVQRIVEEHRGSIMIANAPGGGAIVDMVFPVAEV